MPNERKPTEEELEELRNRGVEMDKPGKPEEPKAEPLGGGAPPPAPPPPPPPPSPPRSRRRLMTGPMILFAAVVLLVGVPASRYNATAAGLVIAYVFVQGAYALTETLWPIHLFVFIDLAVLAIIYCKPPAFDCWPYRNIGHQLCSMWLERSVWDRIVIAGFPLCWAAYALPLDDFTRWWSLYFVSLAQFIAAGGEAFRIYRTCRPAKAEDLPDTPSSGMKFAWAGEWRGGG